MMEFRRKFLTRKTITTIRSYSDLYREIIIFSRGDWLWLMVILAFAYFTWYSVYYLAITPQPFSVELISYSLLQFIVSCAVTLLIFFLAYSATQNPSRTVPEIIAHMLVFYPQPYQDCLGLDYEDIQQLKRIAEIEQNSADWRGAYVNFAIVSIVALLLSNLKFLWNYFIFPVFHEIYLGNDPFPVDPSITMPHLTRFQSVAGGFLVILSVLWLLYKWLSYFREFISSEYANRALLLACEELSAIYRIKSLSQNQRMPFWERRALLELFGYRLIAFEKATGRQKDSAPLDLREKGLWFLDRPTENPIASRISLLYEDLKRNITNRHRSK